MIVRRLRQWLSGVISASRHVPVAKAAGSSAVSAGSEAALPLQTSWLAAARRLRPSRTVPLSTVAGWRDRPVPPRLRGGLIGREQVVAGRSRPLDPKQQIPARSDQAAQQAPLSAPQSQPLAPREELPVFEAAPNLLEDAVLLRQLSAFKQLVRLGVYNEGFRRDALPEQYARSMQPDADDDLASGDEQN